MVEYLILAATMMLPASHHIFAGCVTAPPSLFLYTLVNLVKSKKRGKVRYLDKLFSVTEIVEERSAHLSSLIPDGFYFPARAVTPVEVGDRLGPSGTGFGPY